jgi:hypothetical protein
MTLRDEIATVLLLRLAKGRQLREAGLDPDADGDDELACAIDRWMQQYGPDVVETIFHELLDELRQLEN